MFSEFLSENIIWVGAFVVVANLLVLSFIQGRVKGAKTVSALELPQLQRNDGSVIIDVNEEKDFAAAHIPSSLNVSMASLNADNKALMKNKDKTVILVCQTGTKSTKAAKTLVDLGFNDLHILRGGLLSWTKENLPTSSN